MKTKLQPFAFNSDVVNDENHIYFLPRQEQLYELLRYPLSDDEPTWLTIRRAAMEIINKEGRFPSVVFAPVRLANEDGIRVTCDELCLKLVFMTPDRLKGIIKP